MATSKSAAEISEQYRRLNIEDSGVEEVTVELWVAGCGQTIPVIGSPWLRDALSDSKFDTAQAISHHMGQGNRLPNQLDVFLNQSPPNQKMNQISTDLHGMHGAAPNQAGQDGSFVDLIHHMGQGNRLPNQLVVFPNQSPPNRKMNQISTDLHGMHGAAPNQGSRHSADGIATWSSESYRAIPTLWILFVIGDCIHLFYSFCDMCFRFIRWSANRAVHELARAVDISTDPVVWTSDPLLYF